MQGRREDITGVGDEGDWVRAVNSEKCQSKIFLKKKKVSLVTSLLPIPVPAWPVKNTLGA